MTTPPFEPLTSSVMPRIRPHSPPDPRPFRGFLATLLLLAPAACDPAAESIPYSELKARVAAGEVEAVRVSATRVEATPTEGARDAGAPEGGWRAVPLPEDPGLVPLLEARGVRYEGLPTGGPPVYVLLPLLAGALVVVFLVARAQRGRGVGVPRAAALRVRESGAGDSRTRFEDVAGVDEVKEELRELVEFLGDPGRFERLGVRIPKGVLLVGPPGTGKTLLARAVAGEAGVPFFSLSGSDFVEVYVGVGASRVRQLFDRARAKAPCIVFLDELDAVGRSRSGGPGSNDEREQTLNQLLVEMDGFRTGTGIIVMAATNRPEILDGALLRPGRFDRQVALTRPDAAGREAILRVHARQVPLAPDVDLGEVARQTPGFSGADLANLLNEAGLLTARVGREAIGVPELESAIERIVAGLEKKGRLANPKERRIVAVHEAGHAVVTAALEGTERVRKVTIVPRSIGALGVTYRLPEERSVLQRDELLARLAVLLAGRAAEQRVFGQVSSGAGNDLERASALARRMVSELGMSEALGPVAFGPAHGRLLPGSAEEATGCSEDTARRIDREVQELLSEAAREAQVALEERRSALDALTERLLEREVVHREELLAILAADQGLAGPAPAAASA